MLGSPPQVRGKLAVCRGDSVFDRITPAGAGKTVAPSMQPCRCADHPRRCGENSNRRFLLKITKGSPPQVRGKQYCVLTGKHCFRITPAGAGKTCLSVQLCPTRQDHPRRCGENRLRRQAGLRPKGSPPQVRGKRIRRNTDGVDDGITPAGAGKTDEFLTAFMLKEDHPRRCGENCG